MVEDAKDLLDMEYLEGNYLLQNLSRVYFDISVPHDDLVHANVKLIPLLGWLALVILILAVFNYISLTTAQSTNRPAEQGIRQVYPP